MLFRSVVFALLVFTPGYAQLERFQPGDLGKWAFISRAATDFEEFELTARQYDRLQDAEIQTYGRAYFDPDTNTREANERKYLETVYEVLTDKQETRLHQIMFQRWMNRDDLANALRAFAPDDFERLELKIVSHQLQISKRLNATTDSLPQNPRPRATSHQPLVDFLAWRWEQQTAFLIDQLGRKRVDQLLGRPVTLAYGFVTEGDPTTSKSKDRFGDPHGGGRYFGDHAGAVTGSSFQTLFVGPFDPQTGKLSLTDSGNKPTGRPVDVPVDWSLDNAWENLRDIQSRRDEITSQLKIQIELPQDLETRRTLEQQLAKEETSLRNEIEVARRIIEELGGNPKADIEEIRAARWLFANYVFNCNQPPFLSHINASVEQCDQLDGIFDQFGRSPQKLSSEEQAEYYKAIAAVLDERQQFLWKQIWFRQFWFSGSCDVALQFANIQPTKAQSDLVAAMSRFHDRTMMEITERQHRARRARHGQPLPSDVEDIAYLPLAEKFNETLIKIVGKKRAVVLLGSPMARDSKWKRPVIVPEDLTVEQAQKQLDRLVLAQEQHTSKLLGIFNGERPRDIGSQIQALTIEQHAKSPNLKRRIAIAKRVLEELQSQKKE